MKVTRYGQLVENCFQPLLFWKVGSKNRWKYWTNPNSAKVREAALQRRK